MALTRSPISIRLDGGRVVSAIHVPPKADISGLGRLFGIQAYGSISVVGGAAAFDGPEYASVRERIRQLLDELARIAIFFELAVVDGGTPFGVMRLLGEICYDHQYKFPLIGVAPSGQVAWNAAQGLNYAKTWFGSSLNVQTALKNLDAVRRAPLDEHHSAFVLVEANEWGEEVEMLAGVAHELAGRYGSLEVLINGGAIARRDVTAYLQRGGHVIVLEGSGRFADELATAIRAGYSTDPQIQAMLNTTRVHLFSVYDAPQLFANMLMNLGRWAHP